MRSYVDVDIREDSVPTTVANVHAPSQNSVGMGPEALFRTEAGNFMT